MIRAILSDKRFKHCVFVLIALTMIIPLFTGISLKSSVKVGSTDDFVVLGSISYMAEDGWQDVIRPKEFDVNKITLALYNEDELVKTTSLQSTSTDDEYHLAFVHDSYGGGTYTISNIPQEIDGKPITKCKVLVKGVTYYNDSTSDDYIFGTSFEASNKLVPKTVPLEIHTIVKGEDDTASTSFFVEITAYNSNGTNITATSITKGVYITKDRTTNATGYTTTVPVGLKYKIEQQEKSEYSLIGYSLGYESDGNKVSIQSGVNSLSTFKAEATKSSKAVTKYEANIVNLSKNMRLEWKLRWNDNYSQQRPEPTFKLRYSVDGSNYQDVNSSKLEYLGLSSVPSYQKVVQDTAGLEDITSYFYENLSNVAKDGKKIIYKVEQTTDSDQYEYSYDDESNTFTNNLLIKYTASLVWYEASSQVATMRPTIDQIKGTLHFYEQVGTNYKEISLTDSELEIKQGRYSNVWNLTINKKLPQYSVNGDKIIYILIEGTMDSTGNTTPITEVIKSGYSGEERYAVQCYNIESNELNVLGKCYAGETIYHTLSSKLKYETTKVWRDTVGAIRPSVTVTLWRYPMEDGGSANIDIDKSARVITKGTDGKDMIVSYKLRTSNLTVADDTVNSEIIEFNSTNVPKLPSNYHFPQYDREGKKYIYFVTETMGAFADYKNEYASTYYNAGGVASEVDAVKHGGTIYNTRIGDISIDVTNFWKAASAIADIENTSVEFMILGKLKGQDNYEKVTPKEGSTVITNNGASKTRGNQEVLISQYNDDGNLYEDFIIRITKITKDGQNITLHRDSEYDKEYTFKLGENDYKGSCGIVRDTVNQKSLVYDVPLYKCDILNIITTEKKYYVDIRWKSDIDPITQTIVIQPYSVRDVDVPLDITYTIVTSVEGTAIITNNKDDTQYTVQMKIEGDSKTGFNYLIEQVPGLPQYTEDGFLIDYRVKSVTDSGIPADQGGWGAISNDNKYGATITNMFSSSDYNQLIVDKVWDDDGNIEGRFKINISVTDTEYNVTKSYDFNDYDIVRCKMDVVKKHLFKDPDKIEVTEKIIMEGSNEAITIKKGDTKTIQYGYSKYKVGFDYSIEKGGLYDTIAITLNNTRVKETKLYIETEWIDGSEKEHAGIRPESIQVELEKRLEGITIDKIPITLTSAGCTSDGKKWIYEHQDKLDVYNELGIAYDYVISSMPNLGHNDYKQSLTGRYVYGMGHEYDEIHFKFTNRLKAKTQVTVFQKWLDEAIGNNERPDIYLTLYEEKNGQLEILDSFQNQVWTAGKETDDYDWKIDFINLDKYGEDGSLKKYVIKEELNINTSNQGSSNQRLRYLINYYKKSSTGDLQLEGVDRAINNDYIVNVLNGTVKITGEKIWKNIGGYKPEDLPVPHVKLYRKLMGADDSTREEVNSIKLENGQTAFEFKTTSTGEELTKYTDKGEAYIYTLEEDHEKITQAGECKEGNLYTVSHINNTITNEFNITTNIRRIVVTKKWDRSKIFNASEKNVYPSVNIKLYRYLGDATTNTDKMQLVGQKDISPKEFQDSNGADRDIVFENLLIYSPKGERYKYYVVEDDIDGYSISYAAGAGQAADKVDTTGDKGINILDDLTIPSDGGTTGNVSKINIVNTYEPRKDMKITGKKQWNDYSNFYNLRPAKIDVTLDMETYSESGYANSIPKNNVTFKKATDTPLDMNNDTYIEWTDTSTNVWTYTIHNLPKYAPNGQPYVYTVTEVMPDEGYYVNQGSVYSSMINATDKILTMRDLVNKFAGSFEVKKHWIDGDDKYGFRPLSVTMQLQRQVGDSSDWESVLDPNGSNTPVECVLTKADVVTNTRNNTWAHVFANLPTHIKEDIDGDGEKERVAVKYRCVETKIGKSDFREGSDVIGSYTRKIHNEASAVSEVRNEMSSTALTVTKNWDDRDNYYQTRFGSAKFVLQWAKRSAQTSSGIPEGEWEDVTNASGNKVVLELNQGNAVRDSSGKVNSWTKTFYDLPLAREGNEAEGEDPVVYLYYRVKECQNTDGNPQIGTANGSGGVNITKTYMNYRDDTDYVNAWSYDDTKKMNSISIINHMITNEDANGKLNIPTPEPTPIPTSDSGSTILPTGLPKPPPSITLAPVPSIVPTNGTNANPTPTPVSDTPTPTQTATPTPEPTANPSGTRTTVVEANKRWCKDDDVNSYNVDIELRKSSDGVNYKSYPQKIIKTIIANGGAVSWDHMPAYDEDGNDLTYKAVETTKNTWFRCETDVTNVGVTTGNLDRYVFTNIQLLDYALKKVWTGNNCVLPTSEKSFSSKMRFQKKVEGDTDWTDVKDTITDNVIDHTLLATNRTQTLVSKVLPKLDKYTVDNERIYYRAVEMQINNVDTVANKAYIMTNVDEETGGAVYTDDNTTEVTNKLRTISLKVTKHWDDKNDNDKVRPSATDKSKFNLSLYADLGSGFTPVDSSFYTLTWDTSQSDMWTATIDNLPKYTSDGKNLIKYQLKETTVPKRYFISKDFEIPTFEDAIDSYEYEVTNTLDLLLKLKKYDSVNNKGLQGTTFQLYKEVDGEYNTKVGNDLVADSNGNISFELKDLGNYRLIETKAVQGYELKLDADGEPDVTGGNVFMCDFTVTDADLRQTVNINPNSTVMTFTVTPGWEKLFTSVGLVNKRKLGELTWSKEDGATHRKMNGITFELSRYSNEDGTGSVVSLGNVVTGKTYRFSTTGDMTFTCTGDSTNDSEVLFSKIPWGKYVLKEIATDSGYILPSGEFTFVVNATTVDNASGINKNIKILSGNTAIDNNMVINYKTWFTFEKLGFSNTKLTGGLFRIVSQDDDTVQPLWKNVITDDVSLKKNELNANDVIRGLPVGNYRIEEVAAPHGYKHNDSPLVFSIDPYGNIKNALGNVISDKIIQMKGEAIRLNIINVDEDFITPIDGSEFKLTGQFATNKGSDITPSADKVEVVSGLKWQINAELLPTIPGGTKYVYRLEQTKVPDGYELKSDVIYFIIDENYELVLTDANGDAASPELAAIYSEYIKVSNTGIPSLTFENLRIPRNNIYVTNGEDSKSEDDPTEDCKLFYMYDADGSNARLSEPIDFFIDKSNIGKIQFAVLMSKNYGDESDRVDSNYVKIHKKNGVRLLPVNGIYELDENVEYTLSFTDEFLTSLNRGSKMVYLYSRMPRISDIKGVRLIRRTSYILY